MTEITENRWLDKKMLRRRWGGISNSTLDRLRERPEFPAPVSRSHRGKRWWHIDDIVELERYRRPTKNDADEPDDTDGSGKKH